MKKRNKKMYLLIVLILLVTILGFAIKSSFARYASYINGHGVMEVAGWSFKANNETETISDIKLASTYSAESLAEGKIAPGTYGSFDIVIDGTGSDVAITYKVEFSNETETPRNLMYYFNGHSASTLKELQKYMTGTIAANAESKVKTLNIEWYWHYTTGEGADVILENDAKDTIDAQNIQNCSFDITITGVQTMPKA